MTIFDTDWAKSHGEQRKWLAENGMYSEAEEHSSCGVGLVVSLNGKPSRNVVEAGIDALKAIWHRVPSTLMEKPAMVLVSTFRSP